MFSTRNVSNFAKEMLIKPEDANGIRWHLPFEEPMKIAGLYWLEENGVYDRLPLKNRPAFVTQFPMGEKKTVAAKDCGAFNLSDNTAGAQIRFRTNSTRFLLQGKTGNSEPWDHMPLTAYEGFDLYLKDGCKWNFYGVTRTDHKTKDFSAVLCENLKKEMRDVIIHFPLYNGVKSLAVGLDEKAVIETPTPFSDPRPIVWYGTSTTQGGCASRPGMVSSNILSRMLDREIFNLGFSDNGRGEPEIASMLAEIKDPALYLIDYSGNVDVKALQTTLPMVLDTIRAKHPMTPMLLPTLPPTRFSLLPSFAKLDETRMQRANIMRDEVVRRNQQGDRNIYFFDALFDAFGMNAIECTVDGGHFTDFGFHLYSRAIFPHICFALTQH